MTVPVPDTFRLTITNDRAATVVLVTGELDLSTTPALQAALDSHSDAPIVLDLAGCSFIDSTGIATCLRWTQAATAPTAIVATHPAVCKVFALAIGDRLTLHPTLDTALSALPDSPAFVAPTTRERATL